MTTLSSKTPEEVVKDLYQLLEKQFEKTIVNQHSLYAWQDTFTGKPLEFDEQGNIKLEKFNIINISTDVL